jgi:hypothetical protein
VTPALDCIEGWGDRQGYMIVRQRLRTLFHSAHVALCGSQRDIDNTLGKACIGSAEVDLRSI